MKTIIAGSRWIKDWYTVRDAITASGFDITQVVSGCAKGVDQTGEEWAKRNGKPVKAFPAQWGKLGKSAGYVRNREMADYADALVAVWDGESKGTKHMIDLARDGGLKVFVWNLLTREHTYFNT